MNVSMAEQRLNVPLLLSCEILMNSEIRYPNFFCSLRLYTDVDFEMVAKSSRTIINQSSLFICKCCAYQQCTISLPLVFKLCSFLMYHSPF